MKSEKTLCLLVTYAIFQLIIMNPTYKMFNTFFMVLKPFSEDTVIHEPSLCVYMTQCDECTESPHCVKYNMRIVVLTDTVIVNLMKYLMVKRNIFRKITCIAFNAQAFEAQFILNYMLEKTIHKLPTDNEKIEDRRRTTYDLLTSSIIRLWPYPSYRWHSV